MVCIDMDGTLLNSRRKISEISRNAIKSAHEKGIHVVVSTGRLYTDAEAFSDIIGVVSPIIALNGAVIRGINKDQIIYKSVFDMETSIKLLDIFTKYNVKPAFMTPEKKYCGDFKSRLLFEFMKLMGVINGNVKTIYVPSYRRWLKVFDKERNNIVKCEVNNDDIYKLKEIRDVLEGTEEFEVINFSDRHLEITKKGVSKGKAIEILSGLYKIERDEIIAIGDSENDLSMIEFAGIGVAMGNAIDIIKQKADYITETNDNEGVAKVIDMFVLGEDKS